MLKYNIDLLTKVLNTLATISTKGEDTLAMADSLRALAKIINDLKEGEHNNDEIIPTTN